LRLMGVPNSDVGYTLTTTGRGDHEVHKEHVVALEKKTIQTTVRITGVSAAAHNRPLPVQV
jgi:hypothetical protein